MLEEIKEKKYEEIEKIINNEKIEKEKIKGIVEKFIKNDLILTTHALEYILNNKIYKDEDLDNIINIAKNNRAFILTEEFIIEVLKEKGEEIEKERGEIEKIEKREEIEKEIKKEGEKKEKEGEKNFKIFDYKCISDGKIFDFITLFQDRYKTLSAIIKKKMEYRDAINIEKINEGENVSVIGIISNKFDSKDSITLVIEDLTKDINVIINKKDLPPNTEQIVKSLVLDEVIGVKGKVAKDGKTIFASDITEPDIPYDFVPNKSEKDVYVAFISDLHIGSVLFLQKEFENFLDWLNLKRNRIDIAEKVKYVLIAGDIVDGIGVYPHQEKELALLDIYKQYDFTAELIGKIPSDIEIIIIPGNHDAVRISEPQPEIDKKFAQRLYNMKNVHLCKNPAYVNIEGVNILMYHGASLDNLIRAIPGLSYSEPEKAMREFLKKRHLSPIYADIFPTENDNLVIKNIPDIIHCGHIHSNGYENYKGVHLINSGCFQGKTKFQEELGHEPTPARVPVMNLKTHNLTILDFRE